MSDPWAPANIYSELDLDLWQPANPGETAPSNQIYLGFAAEPVAITGSNAFAPLTHAPSGELFLLIVNNVSTFTLADPAGQITLTGAQIVVGAGAYTFTPSDSAVAVYTYRTEPPT